MTCNRQPTCSADRAYDASLALCPGNGRVVTKCRCATDCELNEFIALPEDTCIYTRNPIWKIKEQTCAEAGASFCGAEVLKSSPSTRYCQSTTCTTADDHDTCCEPKAKCNSESETSLCGSSSLFKTNYASIECIGAACRSEDASRCCDDKALCSTLTCDQGTGYVNDDDKNSELCAGKECDLATVDRSTCCKTKTCPAGQGYVSSSGNCEICSDDDPPQWNGAPNQSPCGDHTGCPLQSQKFVYDNSKGDSVDVCEVCPSGKQTDAGDFSRVCNPILCNSNERVSGNKCKACDDDEVNDAGDDASKSDTTCDEKSTCSGYALCNANSVVKSGASSLLCAGVTCNTGDHATCCELRAQCASLTCTGNFVYEPTFESNLCKGAECSMAEDATTCCQPKATCESKTESELCGSGFKFISDYTTTYCAGTSCVTATDKSTCCTENFADCSTLNCGSDSVRKNNPSTILCSSATCTIAADHTTCCSYRAMCNDDPALCGTASIFKTDPGTITCDSTSCRTDECCDPRAKCKTSTCSRGYEPDLSKENELCVGILCSMPDDLAQCCKLKICEAGYGYQSALPGQAAPGTCIECDKNDPQQWNSANDQSPCGDHNGCPERSKRFEYYNNKEGTCVDCPAGKQTAADDFADTCEAIPLAKCNSDPTLCGSNAIFKTKPELISCAGTSCDSAVDKSTCCVEKATCNSKTESELCGSGFEFIADYTTTYCAGTSCDSAVDKSTCCVEKAKCDSKTESELCGSGFEFIADYTTTYCVGTSCDTAVDKSTCCVEKAKCDSKTESELCGTGFEFIADYTTTYCAGTACYTSTDRDTCCSPTIISATCDTFNCPALFELKSDPNTISCAAGDCDAGADLYTCCESTDELYGRSDSGENECHHENCDGSGNKCVDNNDKVVTKCKCTKDTYFKDYRHVVANVGDYCDEDGFFDEAEDDKFAVGETRDRVLFGRAENCDKRCQRLFEQPGWTEYHTLLDEYESRPCRAEGKTGPKCTDGSSRRRLRETSLLLGAPLKKGVNVVCHDDDGLTEIQKKGFECYGCSKCKELIDGHDYGPVKIKFSTPSQPDLPDHGGCQPFCQKAIDGTGGALYPQRFCGGVDKDGNTLPRGSYADVSPGCFVDTPGSVDPPNRVNYVCNHWRKCTGCKACIDAGEDTNIFPGGFGPAKPKDIYGDGSRIAGECRQFCKARFNFESTGAGAPYYNKWNDGSDGGPVGSKVLLGLTTDTGFAGLNKQNAPADICTWKACSGCKGCKTWSSAADTDIVLGSKTGETYGSKYGSNDGFRFKEPDQDYANEMSYRNHRNMIGGCSLNCKAMFNDPSGDVRDLCTLDECDGCDPCISPDKYIAKDTAKYGKFDRSAGRMHMDEREIFGQETDGRIPESKGTAASNTWARTATCPGFPKCYAYEGVCETRYCQNCDECKNTGASERNKYKKTKPAFKN